MEPAEIIGREVDNSYWFLSIPDVSSKTSYPDIERLVEHLYPVLDVIKILFYQNVNRVFIKSLIFLHCISYPSENIQGFRFEEHTATIYFGNKTVTSKGKVFGNGWRV